MCALFFQKTIVTLAQKTSPGIIEHGHVTFLVVPDVLFINGLGRASVGGFAADGDGLPCRDPDVRQGEGILSLGRIEGTAG